ncbi:WhiB family transcriptional regulator [Microbispora sp. NPDC088329]|uniref:WhiB family transcriptional regulator n=1 Tax=Microbispora sp. NPDC088329 TaxID=3154869 RepID=UPI00344AA111
MTATVRRADPVPYPPVEMARPACRSMDPEMFFPLSGMSTAAPRAVCASCSVRAECLEYGLAYDVHGIWGGTSYPERKAIRKARGIQALPVFFHGPVGSERPKPRPRRPEVAFPPPANRYDPADADQVASSVPPEQRPLSEYDPRQLQIVRLDPPAAEDIPPTPSSDRALSPAIRRTSAAATPPQEPPAARSPRPVTKVVSLPEPSTVPQDVVVSSAVVEVIPPAPAASATVRKRSKPSAGVRQRSESSGHVRNEPELSEEAAPARPAEPAANEVVDETAAADETLVAEEPMKRCPRCRDPKPHAEFYPSADTADGLSIWCRACFRAVRS